MVDCVIELLAIYSISMISNLIYCRKCSLTLRRLEHIVKAWHLPVWVRAKIFQIEAIELAIVKPEVVVRRQLRNEVVRAFFREILKICRQTYSGNIGVEFLHIQDPEEVRTRRPNRTSLRPTSAACPFFYLHRFAFCELGFPLKQLRIQGSVYT